MTSSAAAMTTRWRRRCGHRGRTLLAALAASVNTGCYTTRPVTAASVAPGRMVAVDLTDAGRVALGATLGSGVRRINGHLAGRDGGYVLQVSSIEYLDGRRAAWAGERFVVRDEWSGAVHERRLSPARSWLAAGLGLVTVSAVALGVSLLASGSEGGSDLPSPEPGPSH